jgi:hypothetical protein
VGKRASRAALPDLSPDVQEKIDQECDTKATYEPSEGTP